MTLLPPPPPPLLPPPPLPPKAPQSNNNDKNVYASEATPKPGDKPDVLLSVARGAARVPSPAPSLISIDDSNNIRLGCDEEDYLSGWHNDERHDSLSSAAPRTIAGRANVFWTANKGLALVLIAQLFGTLMNVTTRMLEIEGNDGRVEADEVSIRCKLILSCRQRIPPISDTVRQNDYNRRLRVVVHVLQKNRALSLWHEGSEALASCSWYFWLLWCIWHVL